jgi:hypothetical protein
MVDSQVVKAVAAYIPHTQLGRSFVVLAVEVADTLAETFDDCTCHIHKAGQAEEECMGHATGPRCWAFWEVVEGSACRCLAVLKAVVVEYTSHPPRHVLHLAVSKGSLLLPLASQVCPACMGPAPTACWGRRRCVRAVGERRCSPEPRSRAGRSGCGL